MSAFALRLRVALLPSTVILVKTEVKWFLALNGVIQKKIENVFVVRLVIVF